MILGEKVGAQRALEIWIATSVVTDEELPGAAAALAERLAAGPALAYGTTKMLLSRELDADLAGALELEAMAQARLMTTGDHREFYRAFTEGRAPQWKGR